MKQNLMCGFFNKKPQSGRCETCFFIKALCANANAEPSWADPATTRAPVGGAHSGTLQEVNSAGPGQEGVGISR